MAERGSELGTAELHVAAAGHDEVVDAVVGRVVELAVAHHDGRRGGHGGHGEGGHWCSSL